MSNGDQSQPKKNAADMLKELRHIANCYPETAHCAKRIRAAADVIERALDAKQAEIDRLMLEHCPGEMTPEQTAEWAKHQRRVVDVSAERRQMGWARVFEDGTYDVRYEKPAQWRDFGGPKYTVEPLYAHPSSEGAPVIYGPERQDYHGGPVYRVGASTGAAPSSEQRSGPDFNQETNLHADTIAERHDAASSTLRILFNDILRNAAIGEPDWDGIEQRIRAWLASPSHELTPWAWLEIDQDGNVLGCSLFRDDTSPHKWEPLYRAASSAKLTNEKEKP